MPRQGCNRSTACHCPPLVWSTVRPPLALDISETHTRLWRFGGRVCAGIEAKELLAEEQRRLSAFGTARKPQPPQRTLAGLNNMGAQG